MSGALSSYITLGDGYSGIAQKTAFGIPRSDGN
jgi:hypothetical protein